MDYFAEIAESPDIEEALKRLEGVEHHPNHLMGAPSRDDYAEDVDREIRRPLLPPLRETHPSIWRAELVNWFHVHPDFAAKVWRECERMTLARRVGLLPWPKELKGLEGNILLRALSLSWPTTRDQFIQKLATVSDEKLNEVRNKIKQYHPGPEFIERLVALGEKVDRPVLEFIKKRLFAGGERKKKTKVEVEDIAGLIANPERVGKLAADHEVPVPFSMVLEKELTQIDAYREARSDTGEALGQKEGGLSSGASGGDNYPSGAYHGSPIRKALGRNLVGLAFSGGGIRSATFNLGVLQAIAKLNILRKCDYLSTVSGGGYIGSWFTAWTYRESVDSNLGQQRTADQVQDRMRLLLSPTSSPNPLDKQVRPIRYLREFSNYLTPQAGFLSADTWTMIAIYARNLLLNLLVLLPLIAAVLVVPRVIFGLVTLCDGVGPVWSVLSAIAFGLVLPLAVLLPNLLRANKEKPKSSMDKSEASAPWYARQGTIQMFVVVPLLIAACLTAVSYRGRMENVEKADVDNLIQCFSFGAGIVFLIYLGVIHLGGRFWKFWPGKPWTAARSLIIAMFGAAVAAFALFWVLGQILVVMLTTGNGAWLTLAFGTPLVLTAYSLIIVIQLGLLGTEFPDEQREWWSRLRAWTLIYSFVWMALFTFAIWVPYWTDQEVKSVGGIGAMGAWVLSTVLGIKAGRTSELAANISARSSKNGAVETRFFAGKRVQHAILSVAPYIFAVGLLAMVSLGIYRLLQWNFHLSDPWYAYEPHSLFLIVMGLIVLSAFVSWRIGVNEFSMHHFYKNRLVRCYLGASRWQFRKADWFTGFDANDNLHLSHLDHDSPSGHNIGWTTHSGPYPIVNAALNLVAGEDLAWQERKATSFVFTPKYCGYDVDRAVLQKGRDGSSWPDAYAPTRSYVSEGTGPTLGTAMAISGAAANPNMGKVTTAASAFLMTVFNARLGWWLPNPHHKGFMGWNWRGPVLGITYTAIELFGMTDDRKKFVNLSDGGHFENLGVYELIRRGCRYVIVSDAGQDGSFGLEDLGNLIRKCRTDFGVEIDIALDSIRDRSLKGWSNTHCVVGKIRYPTIPHLNSQGKVEYDANRQPKPEEGWLLYMKPTITGDEPSDVLEYYQRVPEFPHESTADQWFNESQFESYRRLGMHIAEMAFKRYREQPEDPIRNIKELFENLERFWHPPSPKVGEHSTDHAMEYTRIMELLRSNGNLAFLDPALFKEISDAPLSLQGIRDEFYICNALIQLIENVYADLDLEQNYDHPHVKGWMEVFKFWAKQEPFKRTWNLSQSTYAPRFQNFYKDRLVK